MAHCFDFRNRTSSFDLHTLAAGHRLAKLGRLFRSKSQDEVKSIKSPVTSPKASPGAVPKRRFVRVVRNQDHEGEEYENPHLVRRFTKAYWEEQQLQKSKSLDNTYDPENLPYKVSGHTILKKHPSTDSPTSSPPVSKHACFKEDIEVIEFDKKAKIKKNFFLRFQERLVDSSGEDEDSDSEFIKLREHVKGKKAPPVSDYSSEEEETASMTEHIGEICFSDAKKGEMTLSLIPGLDVNGLCSPVKEESEEVESVTDTESEMSDIVMEDPQAGKGVKRLLSSDAEGEGAQRGHEVES